MRVIGWMGLGFRVEGDIDWDSTRGELGVLLIVSIRFKRVIF